MNPGILLCVAYVKSAHTVIAIGRHLTPAARHERHDAEQPSNRRQSSP